MHYFIWSRKQPYEVYIYPYYQWNKFREVVQGQLAGKQEIQTPKHVLLDV